MSAPDQPCRDFDFEFGSWAVEHRRLKHRLAGSADWEEFAGRSSTRPILGGNGNVEDNEIDLPSGTYRAAAVRGYDPVKATWAIWWLDGRTSNALDTPVIGRFRDGIGEFVARDSLHGKPILVRFNWLDCDTAQPRWEQAFSPDDGLTWEMNWTMRFTKVW
jgi:hypothetical protein